MLLLPTLSFLWYCLSPPPLDGAVSLIGFGVVSRSNQFGRSRTLGSPNRESLGSLALGLLCLLLLELCVLLLGSWGLGVVIVFDICEALLVLGDVAVSPGSFLWCCLSSLPLGRCCFA